MEKSCYKCRFRGEVPGSAHSSCRVITENTSNKEKAMELEILLASHQVEMTVKNTGEPEGEPVVKLNEHGVKNGWAAWPLDFDPIWVQDCRFFTEKEAEG
jgi:hypothetical protein